MTKPTESWVRRAEKALDGGPLGEGDKLLRGRRPPVLDSEGIKAVLAPMMAGLVWAAAVFREMVAGTSLDPLGMALRLLAVGLTLRVVLLGWQLLTRIGTWMSAGRYGLVLTSEGLFYRNPAYDVAVPKESIVGVVERGRWQERSAGRRWSEVYVVTDPATGRTHLALPPVFEETSGLLSERLQRWRGAPPEGREITAKPAELASKLYDQCAAGLVDEGVTVIHHGPEWIKKGPYAPLVVGVVAMDAMARGGANVWDAMEPWMIGLFFVAILAIPVRWFWMTRREVSPRKGIALVLTPAEVLLRTGPGILRVRWKELARVSVDAKKKWSVLEGAHQARQLVMTRTHAPTIRYDEPYLGLPVEVGQLLLEAHRSGRLPRDLPPTDDVNGDEEE